MPQIIGPLLLGTAVAGTAGNVYGSVEAGKTAGLQQQQLKNQLSYMNNPSKLAALVNSLRVPLSESMIQNLTRTSSAMTGAAGLGDSPGLATEIAGQTAAPYEQQATQSAIDEALKLIFGGGTQTPNFPTSNMSGLFALLNQRYPQMMGKTTSAPSGSSTPKTTNFSTFDPNEGFDPAAFDKIYG